MELHMVLGGHVVLCMTEADFLKIMFCLKNGENRQAQWSLKKFSFFSQLFIIL